MGDALQDAGGVAAVPATEAPPGAVEPVPQAGAGAQGQGPGADLGGGVGHQYRRDRADQDFEVIATVAGEEAIFAGEPQPGEQKLDGMPLGRPGGQNVQQAELARLIEAVDQIDAQPPGLETCLDAGEEGAGSEGRRQVVAELEGSLLLRLLRIRAGQVREEGGDVGRPRRAPVGGQARGPGLQRLPARLPLAEDAGADIGDDEVGRGQVIGHHGLLDQFQMAAGDIGQLESWLAH